MPVTCGRSTESDGSALSATTSGTVRCCCRPLELSVVIITAGNQYRLLTTMETESKNTVCRIVNTKDKGRKERKRLSPIVDEAHTKYCRHCHHHP
jgi:hypothetical protein